MKFITVFFGVIVLVAMALVGSFIWDSYFIEPDDDTETVVLIIESGDTVKDISRNLREMSIITGEFFFERYVQFSGSDASFQPGEYEIKKGMSYQRLAELMTNIDINEITITIPEGFTIKQIGETLEQEELCDMNDWYSIVGEPGVDYRVDTVSVKPISLVDTFPVLESKPDHVSLEGYVFPDTYRFFSDATAEEIVVKMLANFSDKLSPEMQLEIENRGRSVHQVITVASIVEREVMTDEDRGIVADIFWRRLSAGMPLQADSTVNYVTGKSDPSILNTDRDVNSSWNTYKYPGLPPSPISNPGEASIIASVYPEANDYWYFLTDEDGNVHYAASNDGHNENRAKYLK
jgi:UPF0755 protein